MKKEVNFAEIERRMCHGPSLEDCRRQGQTHRAYQWGPRPWGHWSEEQKAAYMQGYHSA